MSLGAEVTLEWGGAERLFALKGKQIENLEADLNEGIGNICYRVFSRVDFKFRHIRQAIYWGLIGGGMNVTDATKLVVQYVDGGVPIDPQNDPGSNLKTASAILKAVYFGWEALPPLGEAGAGETPAKTTGGTTSANSGLSSSGQE